MNPSLAVLVSPIMPLVPQLPRTIHHHLATLQASTLTHPTSSTTLPSRTIFLILPTLPIPISHNRPALASPIMLHPHLRTSLGPIQTTLISNPNIRPPNPPLLLMRSLNPFIPSHPMILSTPT